MGTKKWRNSKGASLGDERSVQHMASLLVAFSLARSVQLQRLHRDQHYRIGDVRLCRLEMAHLPAHLKTLPGLHCPTDGKSKAI